MTTRIVFTTVRIPTEAQNGADTFIYRDTECIAGPFKAGEKALEQRAFLATSYAKRNGGVAELSVVEEFDSVPEYINGEQIVSRSAYVVTIEA